MIVVGCNLSVSQNEMTDDELTPPEGFAFVVDSTGNYVTNTDGDYVVAEAP